jgi:integrase
MKDGRLRRKGLGRYPEMTLVQARDAWRALRQNVTKGIDPAGNGNADTFAVVVAEWIRRDQATRNKLTTVRGVVRTVEMYLTPLWGERRVDTIAKRDVIELLEKIVDGGAPIKARRTFALLHRFFRWCLAREIIKIHPMAGLEAPGSETARERVLIDEEIVSIWRACSEGPYGQATRLLLLTGARKAEISRLRWSEINEASIRLDGERTKSGMPHTIALSSAALALLADNGGDYVFSVDGGKNPISGWSLGKAGIDARAKIAPWRVHDLRRTVATGLQRLGINLQVIEAVLGHIGGSRSGIVGVYQRHSFDAEKRAALEAWGEHVMGLVS